LVGVEAPERDADRRSRRHLGTGRRMREHHRVDLREDEERSTAVSRSAGVTVVPVPLDDNADGGARYYPQRRSPVPTPDSCVMESR
jgi:hypothetical protein